MSTGSASNSARMLCAARTLLKVYAAGAPWDVPSTRTSARWLPLKGAMRNVMERPEETLRAVGGVIEPVPSTLGVTV